jgi:D-amino peptidase
MRVYISVDMEGIAGVVHWQDTRLEGVEYERARHWMTGEANAAIEGALAAGATEVVVNDSHGQMRNLLAEDLNSEAWLVRGSPKPYCMLEGLQPGFDAAFLVGYHALAGTGSGVLNHSFSGSSIASMKLNDLLVGEVGFNAALAGGMRVPVAMVTGDEMLSREVSQVLPWAERVVVKQGITSWSAKSVSPGKAQTLIRAAAERALRRLPEMSPLVVAAPIKLEVAFFRPIHADLAGQLPGAERMNGTTLAYTAQDMDTINRAWMMMLAAAGGGSQPGAYGKKIRIRRLV